MVVIVVRVAGWGGARAKPMEELKIGHKIKPVSKMSSRREFVLQILNVMPVFSRFVFLY